MNSSETEETRETPIEYVHFYGKSAHVFQHALKDKDQKSL